MKFKSLVILSVLAVFGNCAELFNSGKDDNNDELLLLGLAAGQGCPTSAVTAPEAGTRINFEACAPLDTGLALSATGFQARSVTLSGGLVGTSGASNIVSLASRLSNVGGSKKATVEVVYRLNSATSWLAVHLIGTTNFNGPGFRLNATGPQKLVDTQPSALGTTSWPSSVNTDKTVCLEVHEEGAGAHIFGWQGACASVNRGVYEFEEEDVVIPSGLGGDRVGLILNGATVKSITIFTKNVGTAGSFLPGGF
ncbi:MAG: hypothetical protein O9301_07130 [Leptospira sp.]|nr:hypothetical protein [Leptospira sp.]